MKRYMTAPELGQNFGRVVRVGEAGEFYLLSYSGLRKNGGEDRIGTFYPLNAIFDAHSRGNVTKEFPDLNPKDLHLCSAFLATNVPGHPAYIKNNRGKRVKILFDENLPYGLVSALTEELPNLSHVYLEGMDGFADEFIFHRPWYQLKTASAYDRRKSAGTKYIIITRDTDLTDLARNQWCKRIAACATPEDLKFNDVNAVFRVVDESFTNVENVVRFKELAQEIMKAAYSCKAASYTISKSGVHIERGSSLENLIEQVERKIMYDGEGYRSLGEQERSQGRSLRLNGQYDEFQAEMALRDQLTREGLAPKPFLP